MSKKPSYPALKISQNNQTFYFATIPIKDLFEYCFVARRNEDPKHGFQRLLSEERASDIAAYLKKADGSIPINIVLSGQPNAKLKYDSRSKTIAYERTKKAFLVLDGQHRLWGYNKCGVKHRVPVAIYENLKRQQETKLFIDINTNQKGVPAALLLDIKQVAMIENQKEQILRQIFDKLSKDSDSRMRGKLSASRSIPGKISRVTFNRAVGVSLDSGIFIDSDDDTRYKTIRNYINAFYEELAEGSKQLIVRSAFFEAIFDIFNQTTDRTLTQSGDLRETSLRKMIRPVAGLDYTIQPTRRTKVEYVRVMKEALRSTRKRVTKDLV